MNQFRFETEIVLGDVAPAEVVRERVYDRVRVTAEWPADIATAVVRIAIEVRGDLEPRDAPAYVELFFHDLFLLLNLSSPGSFGGTISTTGDAFRVRELSFDARVFAYGAPLATLPLADVVAWYDGLRLGTQQLASDGPAIALFQLLHLARAAENEEEAIVRLAIAAEALGVQAPPRLFELRDEIALGRAAIVHPMQDDALDPRVEDVTREWIEVADAAAGAVIGALQELVSRGAK